MEHPDRDQQQCVERSSSYDLHCRARQWRSRQIGFAFAALADGAVSLAAVAFGAMKSALPDGSPVGTDRRSHGAPGSGSEAWPRT